MPRLQVLLLASGSPGVVELASTGDSGAHSAWDCHAKGLPPMAEAVPAVLPAMVPGNGCPATVAMASGVPPRVGGEGHRALLGATPTAEAISVT